MLEISQNKYIEEEIDEGLFSNKKNEDEKGEQENYEEDKNDPFLQYLSDIGKFDLISVEEEKRLGEIIQGFLQKENEIFNGLLDGTIKLSGGKKVKTCNKLISLSQKLKKQESKNSYKVELALKNNKVKIFNYIKSGNVDLLMDKKDKTDFDILRVNGENAINKFVNANLRLVIKIARSYKNRSGGLSISDLVQEGNIGLLKAVKKYNPKSENKFSVYAVWWIRQAISSTILSKTSEIYVSKKDQKRLNIIKIIKRKFIQKEGRFPTDEELAIESETSIGEMKDFLQRVSVLNKRSLVSIDSPIGNDDESFTVGDILVDTNIQPEYKVQSLKISELITKILTKLNKKEKSIIELRFGLNGNEEHSLDEIGKKFGVTREAIRLIQLKVIKKIKKITESMNIQEEDIF